MQIITALYIDCREGFILLTSAIEDDKIPMKLIPLTRLQDAATYLTLTSELPDIVIVSSGIIIQEGPEKLLDLMHDDRLAGIKLFILTEFPAEEKHLLRGVELNAYFIAMPLDYTETKKIAARIYDCWNK